MEAAKVEDSNQAESSPEPEHEVDSKLPEQTPNEPAPKDKKPKLKFFRSRLVIIIVVAVVVALNGAGIGANIYLHTKAQALTKKSTPTITIIRPTTTDTTPKPSTPTVTNLHYVSNALHLEFDYPVDWRIEGSADNKSLSLNSAPFSIADDKGKAQQGSIVLTITDPAQDQNGFGFFRDDNKISTDSESLVYTNPSAVQRKTTHISFVSDSYNTGTSGSYPTDFILVSGNLVYRAGQTLGSQKYKSIDPHIYAYFNNCLSGCHYLATGTISPSEWQNNPNFVKLRQLLASLRFSQ